ncbi:hypothetical protein CIB84_003070 [Bambusicola thoracicus]|uniref:Uncharacterized protein n=1 Tax=Bambusicola thoracicus TaxID=9083 RepID=A0A2P4T9Y3_BAMTH|nr:hypothetical protein CIB84_003070 [Bambusicola thoracicus]
MRLQLGEGLSLASQSKSSTRFQLLLFLSSPEDWKSASMPG